MNRKDLARNPVLPPEHHIPDGEAHVMLDGKLYVYGGYDNQQDFNCSNIYRVASTADMKAWEVHDIALRAEDIPWYNNPEAPHYPGVDWSRLTPFMRERMPELVLDSPDEQTAIFIVRGKNYRQKQVYKISAIKIIHDKDQIQGKQASLDSSISAQFTLNVPQTGFFYNMREQERRNDPETQSSCKLIHSRRRKKAPQKGKNVV